MTEQHAACPARAGTFDLLVYADKDMATPETWEESDPRYIENPAEVHLRSFTTKIHKVRPGPGPS
jgi:mitotic spindle assembly checkpoint protein MAD2